MHVALEESGWELKVAGGDPGKPGEVFCSLCSPHPQTHEQESRDIGALRVASEETGFMRVSEHAGEGSRLRVCVSSQPPRGKTSPRARQRAQSCGIWVKAECKTKGSGFSGRTCSTRLSCSPWTRKATFPSTQRLLKIVLFSSCFFHIDLWLCQPEMRSERLPRASSALHFQHCSWVLTFADGAGSCCGSSVSQNPTAHTIFSLQKQEEKEKRNR